jgi:predicted DNA-binding transcriptional regulator YafY
MSKRESIARYNLIIKKIKKNPATFQEITDYLQRESELQDFTLNTTVRTFQRDLNDIRSIYDIDIQFDRSRKVYYIDSEGYQEAFVRIMEAYDTFNALSITDRLSDFIHFENRRTTGTENLYGLLHAIKNRLRISFIYHKYWENEATNRILEPYALKEFRNRWYLVGNDVSKNQIRIFALDRMRDLNISRQTFVQNQKFDVNDYFRDCFGIISPGHQKAEEVFLSFTPDQGKYIKSLPLHHSQQVLADNQQEVLIKLKLVVTFDFIMELLSHGTDVKVIQPQSLIDEIKRIYMNALNQYSD